MTATTLDHLESWRSPSLRSVTPQIEDQPSGDALGQRYARRQPLRLRLVELELLPHDDLEPAVPVAHDAEHLLVRASAEEWLIDHDRPARDLRFAPYPV